MKIKIFFLVIGLVVFGAIAFAIAGGSSDELAELENNLTASGYGWLVNASLPDRFATRPLRWGEYWGLSGGWG